MNNPNVFRSVEEWRAALMALPENSFFELLRSVSGNIKTPFSKQKLLDDLSMFLSRAEIREIIAAYIDAQDHKVIAAVALLGGPAPGELESFFAGEISCAELQALLVNLEERLILYRFRDGTLLRLALNPVLEPVLEPFAADTRCLFPVLDAGGPEGGGGTGPAENRKTAAGAPEEGGPGTAAPCGISGACMTDGRIPAALYAFFSGKEEPLKAGAGFCGLRKKVLDEGKKIFPGLDLDLTVNVLLELGLFQCSGRDLVPCREKMEDYGRLSHAGREEYWAAGLCLCLNGNGPGPAGAAWENGITGRASTARLHWTASFIHRFLRLAVPGKKYPEVTLRRYFELLKKSGGGAGSARGFTVFDALPQLRPGPFSAALEAAGLLETAGGCWQVRTRPACQGRDSGAEDGPAADPVIVMDSPFSFILYPEIPFADALALGAFCTVKGPAAGQAVGPAIDRRAGGGTVCFVLTRESAVRGFDQGLSAGAMTGLLDRLSGNRLDANLGWTLKEWERRYEGVSLHQGTVLCLAEDRRYLAGAEPLASLIQRTLAPGVYLISSWEKAEAVKALRKAGVDIIAQPPAGGSAGGEGAPAFPGRGYRNSFPVPEPAGGYAPPQVFPFTGPAAGSGGERAPSTEGTGSARKPGRVYIENFRRILEKKQLSGAEREELSARIERRLVLTGAQLEGASLRYGKLEARGLDYTGKAIIAKQALGAGSMLEVSWPGPGGAVNRTAGRLQALEKKDGESILVIKPLSGEEDGAPGGTAGDARRAEGDTIRIPLGKISLLRRVKQSIFGD